MRAYELCLILQSDISDDNIEGIITNFSKKIDGSGGRILSIDKQGRKSLKYPIKRQYKGFYCFIQYRGNENCLEDIARFLKFNENVIRYTNLRIGEEEITTIKPESTLTETSQQSSLIEEEKAPDSTIESTVAEPENENN